MATNSSSPPSVLDLLITGAAAVRTSAVSATSISSSRRLLPQPTGWSERETVPGGAVLGRE
jgi:hypothetical protein